MKKIPLDRVDLWRSINGIDKNRRELIARLTAGERDRKKRRALRVLWTRLFDQFRELPFKRGIDGIVHGMTMALTTAQIQEIISAQGAQKGKQS